MDKLKKLKSKARTFIRNEYRGEYKEAITDIDTEDLLIMIGGCEGLSREEEVELLLAARNFAIHLYNKQENITANENKGREITNNQLSQQLQAEMKMIGMCLIVIGNFGMKFQIIIGMSNLISALGLAGNV